MRVPTATSRPGTRERVALSLAFPCNDISFASRALPGLCFGRAPTVHMPPTAIKNPHAVALGRLGGAKGGPARAKALSARRRTQIAKRAATARAASMSADERQELARRAAAIRWSTRSLIANVAEGPSYIRRLLGKFEPSSLRWSNRDHRYVIVREILLRGDHRAVQWLHGFLPARDMSNLVRAYAGAGCTERERQKLRRVLRLSLHDIPRGSDAVQASVLGDVLGS